MRGSQTPTSTLFAMADRPIDAASSAAAPEVERRAAQVLDALVGAPVSEIAERAGIRTRPLHVHALAVRKLLELAGVWEWLTGAGISVKVVRTGSNGVPIEKMTFRNFSHDELPREEWPTSDLRSETRRILIVVFAGEQRGVPVEFNVLVDYFFWSPDSDEDRRIESGWSRCREAVAYRATPPKEADRLAVHVATKGRDSSDLEESASGATFKKECLAFDKEFVAELLGKYGQR